MTHTFASGPRSRWLVLAFSVLLSACSNVVHKPEPISKLVEKIEQRPARPYEIAPGDELEIRFFYAPELNDSITVRPDGRISIMFAQDVQAAGLTTEELANAIKGKLADHVKQLDMVIVVRSFANQRAFVGGEVVHPGTIALKGRENIVQVLNEAGWIVPTGKRDEVILIRKDKQSRQDEIYTINLEKIMRGEDLAQNITVMPGDQILVPPSNVTSFDRWIDQYIRQALPFSNSFVVTNDYRNR